MRYKKEAYCSTNWRCTAAFPFLQGLEASKAQHYKWGGTAVQIGGVLQYVLDKLYGLRVPKLCPQKSSRRGEHAGAFLKAGPIFQQPFPLPEGAQTLAGITCHAAGKSGQESSRSFEICRKTLPARTFRQPHPSQVF